MIDRMLTKRIETTLFPRRSAKPFAEFELEKGREASLQRLSFGVDYKYVIRLEVGVEFIANEVELEIKEKNAKMQLRHELYKDVISGLREIIGVSSELEVQSIASGMIDQMLGK